MNKSLEKYPHIPFDRKEITTRIKETQSLINSLKLIAKHPDKEHRLYKDENTKEYWQFAYAWNWGSKPYCFLVPEIDIDDWKNERFVDPDELSIYVASMKDYLSIPTNRQIENLPEHVKQLQQIGNLPKAPQGRWFGPYRPEKIIPNLEHLAV